MLSLEVSRIRGILDDGIMARELNRAQQIEEARNRQARYEESRGGFFGAAAGALSAGLNSFYGGWQSTPGPQPPNVQPGYPQPGYPQPGYPQPGYPQPGYAAPQPGYGYPAPNMGNNYGGYPLPPGFYTPGPQPPRR